MIPAGVDVDARGLRCPWPALRLARAMRAKASVVIVADDPVAPAEIAALAEKGGWRIADVDTEIGRGFRVSRS